MTSNVSLKSLFDPEKPFSIPKILNGLKTIHHDKALDDVSFQGLDIKESDVFYDDRTFKRVLEYIFKKCNLRADLYGSIDELCLKIRFDSFDPEVHTHLTMEQILDIVKPEVCKAKNMNMFVSKQETIMGISYIVRLSKYTILADIFLKKWIASFIERELKLLKETYSFLPFAVMQQMLKEFKKAEISIGENLLTIQDFSNLRDKFEAFDVEGLHFFDKVFMKKINFMNRKTPISTNQQLFVNTYVQIQTITTRCVHVLEEVLKPVLICDMKDESAVLRVFYEEHKTSRETEKDVILAKELDEVLQIAMKKRLPDKEYKRELFKLETEEDRKNGIVYGLYYESLRPILKSHKLAILLDLSLVMIPEDKCVSSYGTICQLSDVAFRKVVQILAIELKVFQKIKTKKDFEGIVAVLEKYEHVFGRGDYPYFIETWKMNEVINEIRSQVLKYARNCKIYQVRRANSSMVEAFAEVQKLLANTRTIFQDLPTDVKIPVVNAKNYDIRMVYEHYSRMIEQYLSLESEKINGFLNPTEEEYDMNKPGTSNQYSSRTSPKLTEVHRELSSVDPKPTEVRRELLLDPKPTEVRRELSFFDPKLTEVRRELLLLDPKLTEVRRELLLLDPKLTEVRRELLLLDPKLTKVRRELSFFDPKLTEFVANFSTTYRSSSRTSPKLTEVHRELSSVDPKPTEVRRELLLDPKPTEVRRELSFFDPKLTEVRRELLLLDPKLTEVRRELLLLDPKLTEVRRELLLLDPKLTKVRRELSFFDPKLTEVRRELLLLDPKLTEVRRELLHNLPNSSRTSPQLTEVRRELLLLDPKLTKVRRELSFFDPKLTEVRRELLLLDPKTYRSSSRTSPRSKNLLKFVANFSSSIQNLPKFVANFSTTYPRTHRSSSRTSPKLTEVRRELFFIDPKLTKNLPKFIANFSTTYPRTYRSSSRTSPKLTEVRRELFFIDSANDVKLSVLRAFSNPTPQPNSMENQVAH
ncbi:unnamed protein product [Caenorhabditis angaria]|uniref:Uncharacterized protein n=1 Tax=Caenorhabditis angaria TaxID=860376 RepID=A0A9P1IL40_9PELO|nr:unnamed protein product [Caenorhabditis angaria]